MSQNKLLLAKILEDLSESLNAPGAPRKMRRLAKAIRESTKGVG